MRGLRKLVSFRLDSFDQEQLDQLVELVRWRDEADNMRWRRVTRTSALMDAVRWSVSNLTSLKRTADEKGAAKEKATVKTKPKTLPQDCGRKHPQPLCMCLACKAAKKR